MADNREKWKMKMDFLLTVSDVSGLTRMIVTIEPCNYARQQKNPTGRQEK
jgi:hypothetical protein